MKLDHCNANLFHQMRQERRPTTIKEKNSSQTTKMRKNRNRKHPAPPIPPFSRPPKPPAPPIPPLLRPPRPPPPNPNKRSIGTQTQLDKPLALAISDRLTLENHQKKSLAEMVNKVRSDQLVIACRIGMNAAHLPIPNTMPVRDLVRYGIFCRQIKNHLVKKS